MELTKEYFDQQLSNLATKDDLLELATKNDLALIRADLSEVKEKVNRIDFSTDEDHRAALHDIADLKTRMTALEQASSRQ